MKKIIEENKEIAYSFLVFLLYISPFSSDVGLLLSTISAAIWLKFYLTGDSNDKIVKMMNLMIYSLPVSFVSIFGLQSEKSYINWFIIFSVIFLLLVTKENFKNRKKLHFDLICKSLVVTILGLLVSYTLNVVLGNTKNFNQLMMMLLFLITVLSGYIYFSHKKLGRRELNKMLNSYSQVTIMLSLSIIVQWILYLNGVEIGRIMNYYGGRLALGLINFDFSFLSLIVINGIFYNISQYLDKEKSMWRTIYVIALHIFSSYLTSARTGLVSFVAVLFISAFLYVIILNKLEISLKKRFILFSFVIIISSAIMYTIAIGRGFHGSGRDNINVDAISDFIKSPIIGKGLGWMGLNNIVPHNFFIQYMVQTGLIFLIPLLVSLTLLLNNIRKSNIAIFLGICISLVGSMFVPDILSSRFFPIQYLLGIISINLIKEDNDEKNSSFIQ